MLEDHFAVINNHTEIIARLLQSPVVAAFEEKYQFRKKWAFLSNQKNS